MERQTKVLGFSVPKQIADEYENIAKQEHKTKSELFREMIRKYKEARELANYFELQEYGSKKAKETGIETEEDVMRLIHEARGA